MNQLPWENITWDSLVVGDKSLHKNKVFTLNQIADLIKLNLDTNKLDLNQSYQNGLIQLLPVSKIEKIQSTVASDNDLINTLIKEFEAETKNLHIDANTNSAEAAKIITKFNSLVENIGYAIFCMVSNKRPKSTIFKRIGYYTLSQRGFNCA